jgi:hypothetical protein
LNPQQIPIWLEPDFRTEKMSERCGTDDLDQGGARGSSMASLHAEKSKAARAALYWTIRDLAGAGGAHRNTVSNIEVGR